MFLERCKDQPSRSLDEFYQEEATSDEPISAAGGTAMLSLIARLRALPAPERAWGLTSLSRLVLLADNDWRSPKFVTIATNGPNGYFVEYLMPAAQAPWPQATVQGEARSEDEAVSMIRVAMQRSEGWGPLPVDAHRPTVLLYSLDSAALIAKRPSGVIYLNQTMGTACAQSQQEGILLPFNGDPPLDEPSGGLAGRLRELTANLVRLDDNKADLIDAELAKDKSTDCARVDRSRLAESHEAWVHVRVARSSHSDLGDLAPCTAVLTWPNSD